jgi:predicted CoA-substrate-specific enzyme activase
MITAGVDVGNETIKAVILNERRIASWTLLNTRGDIHRVAETALRQAADHAALPREGIQHIVATGAGWKEVKVADSNFTEITCSARGAFELFPLARTVIDVGAEECRVLRTDGKGKVIDFFVNDKCAAGIGMFIETMAKALSVSLEEAGPLSLTSSKVLPLSTSCVVFAESEVISLINGGESKADVLRAVHVAAAMKAFSLLRRVGITDTIVVIGGVALNVGFIDSLRKMLDVEVQIPQNPRIVAALGAALLAGQGK